ncbi:cysteine desulfurase family protein [Mycetocola zhadangensis]|uniref:Cysteine desulfurase n=1 Tax=Mycetocola zhadangensis TaxID=1164595 RepID=A0A3L7JBL9_9MICO|nr:cysteine desulfurase family protein [Mycetocola zhadangensis]RLQ85892.1 cysteine desulfurase [Mycetocola zhadangensis]GGE86715.1 cysteine desulfurase [Mycetocola zhadangensis]
MVVYLDHAATTPMIPEAIDAYTDAMRQVGNPASIHSQGQSAKRMLEEAREVIATSLSCDPIEVVLTSGGTESINLALKGIYWKRNVDSARQVILAPGGEHHATIDTLEWLEKHEGAEISWLPLDGDGTVEPAAVERALAEHGPRVALITMLWANNEVGTIQPVTDIAALAAAHDVPLHVDAVAAYGYLPVDFAAVRRDSGSTGGAGLAALSVSAHKIGGPVGIGALVVSRSAQVEPLLHGGGQQRQVRSGTQDVAGTVSFAVAARFAQARLSTESGRLTALRNRVIAGILDAVPTAKLNGATGSNRLPGNAHFAFPGCEGDSLLFLLDMAGVSVSTGSACQAGIPEPSHVLRAMGRDELEARGALRVTLGHSTTDDDIDALIAAVPHAYAQAARAGLSDRKTVLGS